MHKQLDKALTLYESGGYNEDEDIELLRMFAMIADINNAKVMKETQGDCIFVYKTILHSEVSRASISSATYAYSPRAFLDSFIVFLYGVARVPSPADRYP